jgi:hypothetical protein
MEITGTMTETELADFLVHSAVQKLWFVQLDKDKYEVIASLNWKPGNWRLLSVRKKPREWVSLDRLAKSILSKCVKDVPVIELVLDRQFSSGGDNDTHDG